MAKSSFYEASVDYVSVQQATALLADCDAARDAAIAAEAGAQTAESNASNAATIAINNLLGPAPLAGQIPIGKSGGVSYAPVTPFGDVTLAYTGQLTITAGAVGLSKMAALAASTILGNNTGGAATPIALTGSQVKSLLGITQADVAGLTTASTPSFAGLTLTGPLTYGGVLLTNAVTGTGKMVLSTAPSLSGTVTLSSYADGVLSTKAGIVTSIMAREVLTANRTYYVAPSGSNSNNGLSSGSAFQTLQYAGNIVAGLDLNGHQVVIQMQDGTYTSGLIMNGPLVGATDESALVIQGNGAVPANTFVSTTTGPGFQASNGAKFTVQYVKVAAVYNMYAEHSGSKIICKEIVSDGVAVTNSIHFYARRGGYVEITGNIYLYGSGTPDAFFEFTHQGRLWMTAGNIVNFQNVTLAVAYCYGLTGAEMTITGTALLNANGFTITGKQYHLSASTLQQVPPNSTIPGVTAGDTTNGGVYITTT